MYYFHAKRRGRTQRGASALQHVAYILRDTQGSAADHVAYMLRWSAKTNRREDIIASGHGNLPAWADDSPMKFWQAAEEHERANGRTATTWIITLPRELSREDQLAAIEDLMQTQFGMRHPYVWAMHEAEAMDGGKNPHVHVAFASQVLDGIERKTPEHFFRQWTSQHPERGGARKDTRMHARGGLIRQRQAWADICNGYLERGGHTERLDPRTLAEQGIERDPVEYLSPREVTRAKQGRSLSPGMQERLETAAERQAQWTAEQAKTRAAWERRKQELGWHEGMPQVDRLRAIAEQSRPPRQRTWEERQAGQPMRTVEEKAQRLSKPLIGNRNSRIYHTPEHKNYGDVVPQNQVLFWTVEEAEAAGFREARNLHYGRGTGEAMVRELTRYERELSAHITTTRDRLARGERATPMERLKTQELLRYEGPGHRTSEVGARPGPGDRGARRQPGEVRLRQTRDERGRGQAVRSRIFEEDYERREREGL